ncbi:SDR family NAD(P)-dependent oxidoreductase [Gordonia polyisoprenivorans]|uniref:SDR family NAD(P)-dependent oxidoreductase n=1 Tax=Gordonia polyisoprenivorans TaxID=84595 RepID=UPI001AD7083E|nr:SDR family NAD(P)-dependent oxidoreductase [Gordonia polyisoprenivorans]QTI70941.1 SDR family NAD(P)-dependent oxidoreductase [Gordonia polyisoprenivorans]
MGSLDGLVAIVTGAGRGLGRAHALYLAQEGASVVVNDPGVGGDGSGGSDAAPAEDVVAEIKAAGGNAVANLDSCADWSAAERLVRQAVDTFGKLDILVNNAGILRDRMSFKMSENEWDAVINVHLKGHFAPSRFAAEYWRGKAKSGDGTVYGRIINTSSESGYFGMAGQVNYATAKAGIVGMTMTMARELEKIGVTVNAIAPRARTRMTTSTFTGYPGVQEGTFDNRAPETISPVVAWLASPQAGHISAKVFACYAGELDLQTPIELEVNISTGERAWTVEVLSARSEELFKNGRTPGVAPMRSGIGGN